MYVAKIVLHDLAQTLSINILVVQAFPMMLHVTSGGNCGMESIKKYFSLSIMISLLQGCRELSTTEGEGR